MTLQIMIPDRMQMNRAQNTMFTSKVIYGLAWRNELNLDPIDSQQAYKSEKVTIRAKTINKKKSCLMMIIAILDPMLTSCVTIQRSKVKILSNEIEADK